MIATNMCSNFGGKWCSPPGKAETAVYAMHTYTDTTIHTKEHDSAHVNHNLFDHL